MQRDQPARALPLLTKSLRSNPDRFLRAEILWKRAESLRALGEFRTALADYWAAHKLYRLCGVGSERLRTLLGASGCLRILGRFDEAARMWRDVSRMDFFKQADPSPEEIRLERALVERGAGRLAGARAILLKCLRGLKKTGDVETLRHVWWALGGTERFLGNYRAALAAYQRAETLARRLKDPSGEAYALCGQAGCLRILGDGKSSFKKYRRAHQIFRRTGDPFGQAYGYCGMGNSLRAYGDAARALPLYKKSHDLYRKVGDEGSLAFALWGMGGSLRRLKKFSLAAARYKQALGIFRQVKDARGEVMALLGLACVGKEWGEDVAAERFLGQAVRAAVREKLPYERTLAEWVRRPESAASRFKRFGVAAEAVKRWKDLP